MGLVFVANSTHYKLNMCPKSGHFPGMPTIQLQLHRFCGLVLVDVRNRTYTFCPGSGCIVYIFQTNNVYHVYCAVLDVCRCTVGCFAMQNWKTDFLLGRSMWFFRCIGCLSFLMFSIRVSHFNVPAYHASSNLFFALQSSPPLL